MAKIKVHSNAKIKFILSKDGKIKFTMIKGSKIKIKYSKQEEKTWEY